MTDEHEATKDEAIQLLEAHADNHREMGQHGKAEQMAECVAVLTSEIDRLRGWVGAAIGDFERNQPGQAYVCLLNAKEGLS